MVPKTNNPSFKLISCTERPIETLFACWAQSRPMQYPALFEWLSNSNNKSGVINAHEVYMATLAGVITKKEVEDVFKQVITMSIPVSESIHFTWGFCNLPIEWREQAVRKRQWGFWITSMREFGMDDFVSSGRWTPPPEGSVSNDAMEYLEGTLQNIEAAYCALKKMGVPQEIARKVIPLCASHNGTMFSNLRTLLDTVSSRGCYIAQLDLWGSVLKGISSELSQLHSLLGAIISPPCFDRFSDVYKGCKYKMINENRLSCKDPYAPCPLFCMNEKDPSNMPLIESSPCDYDRYNSIMSLSSVGSVYIKQAYRLLEDWSSIWNRNPFTGKLL